MTKTSMTSSGLPLSQACGAKPLKRVERESSFCTPRLSAAVTTASSARKSTGSASAPNNASRLAPMPSKGDPGVEGGENGGEAPHAEQIGAEDEVALEGEGRGHAAERNQGKRGRGGSQSHGRACNEHPGGAVAEHFAFADELGEVVVELEQGLAVSSGKLGLHAVDDAEGERRKKKRERQFGEIEPEVHYAIPHMRSATSVTRM